MIIYFWEVEKRIRAIVAPLDWGLGHATRCIPIIRELLKHDAEVIIAASGRAAQLLKEEFPQLTHINLSGYNVRYSSFFSMPVSIALQIPKIIFAIVREHFQLKIIIKQYQPDVIISDNRYGLWNKEIYSVFITHQLMVKCTRSLSFLEPALHKIIFSCVKRFNECWIPDVEGVENISGDLSHKYPLPANAKYIGWLSRFNYVNGTSEKKYDLLVLLSGTEPLRTELEKKLAEQIKNTFHKTLMVRGVTEEQKQFNHQNNSTTVSHLSSEEIITAMQQSDIIICRPGYSSLMDLAATGKKAMLIPTPGQTEQEYLAEELMKKKKYFSSSQKNFRLEEAVKESVSYKGFSETKFKTAISTAVELLLKKITAG
jgi:uncharacterized protein (TIGR00661 family)